MQQKNQSLIKKLNENTRGTDDLSLISKIKSLMQSISKAPALIKKAVIDSAMKMANLIKDSKLKKQALALLTAAMLTATVGCGEVAPETQETNQIIHENTESDYAETSVLEKYEDVDGYVSDLANEILNDPKYPEYKATYNEEKQNGFDCYGTRFNPVCYNYFENLYHNSSKEDLRKYTKVLHEFYGQDSLFIVFVSSPLLSDNIKGEYGLMNTRIYSMLEFPNLDKEEMRDLIKSNLDKDILTHAMLLKNVFNSKDYNVLAENINVQNVISYSQLGLEGNGVPEYMFSGLKSDLKSKYIYSFVKNENEEKYDMYYSETDLLPYDKERLNDLSIENLKNIRVELNEKFNFTIFCDEIDHFFTYNNYIDYSNLKEKTQ